MGTPPKHEYKRCRFAHLQRLNKNILSNIIRVIKLNDELGSGVRIVTKLQAGPPENQRGEGREIFHFSVVSRLTLGPTQPAVRWVPQAFPPGIKQQGRDLNHLSLYSAES
jgi:hypothetical protein